MLNLLGLVGLHKAGHISSCRGKIREQKTPPEADTKRPASMELVCPRPSEPRAGCRGMHIGFVQCESQIHLGCAALVPPPPRQHPIPQIRCHFPATPQVWNVTQKRHLSQFHPTLNQSTSDLQRDESSRMIVSCGIYGICIKTLMMWAGF